MRRTIRTLLLAVAVGGGLMAASTAPASEVIDLAAPIILDPPAPIASWPIAKCDPAKHQYIFPVTTTGAEICKGKAVRVGPGWWWRSWPGLVGANHYLSYYEAPTQPDPTSKAQYLPGIRLAGHYDIWVSWRATHNRADEVPFWIFPDDGKTYKMFVNQKSDTTGFRAVKLGNFFLEKHAMDKVVVEMRNDEGTHSKGVDGIFLKYTGPKNVTRVTASDGVFADKIRVRWTGVPGATGYKIYRSASTNTNPRNATAVGSVVGAGTTEFDDIGLNEGETFNYWVKAVGALGLLSKSYSPMNQGSTGVTPGVPQQVTATATLTDKVEVEWDAVDGATGYRVYRAPAADGTKAFLGEVAAPGLLYADVPPAADTSYFYFVTATKLGMESGYSAAAEGMMITPAAGH